MGEDGEDGTFASSTVSTLPASPKYFLKTCGAVLATRFAILAAVWGSDEVELIRKK